MGRERLADFRFYHPAETGQADPEGWSTMPKREKVKRPTSPEAAPHDDPDVEALVEALNAPLEPQVVIRQPGRTFWPEPHGCVRGPEEDEDAFMRRVWANAEPLKEMMLRNKHNATTVEGRTDAELAIESMGTPGEFQRLQQEKRWDEEDERRRIEEQMRATGEARGLPRPEGVEADATTPQADHAAPSAKDTVRGRRLLFPLMIWIVLLAVSELAVVLGAWHWGQGDNLWQKVLASWPFFAVPLLVCAGGFLLHSGEPGKLLFKRCRGED